MKNGLKTLAIVWASLCCVSLSAQVVTPTACATETFMIADGDILTDPSDGNTGGIGGNCTTTDSGDPGDYPNAACVTTTTVTAPGPFTLTFTSMRIFSNFDWLRLTDLATGAVLFDNSAGGADAAVEFLTDLTTTTYMVSGTDLLVEFNATAIVSTCGFEATISVDDTCVDATLIDPNVICPGIFLQVIGCDCVVYNNACESQAIGGVTEFAGPAGVVPWNPGDPCPFPIMMVDGCTDALACNFDPAATNDDGTCIFVNDPCDDGDPNTINDIIDPGCACSGSIVSNGCTDATACNFDPAAMADDGSCLFTNDPCDDGDPATANDAIDANCVCAGMAAGTLSLTTGACNCAAGIDTDGDGLNDFAQITIFVSPGFPGEGPYSAASTDLYDDTGVLLSPAALTALINANDPLDGSGFNFNVFLPADGTTTYNLNISDQDNPAVMAALMGEGPCAACTTNPIPTASEWGLLCLALSLLTTIALYVRRREDELDVELA